MDYKETALQLTLKAMELNLIEDSGNGKGNAEAISTFYLDVYSAITANDDTAAKNLSWKQQ